MEITTYSAQVKVQDRDGSCGVNINRSKNCYMANLQFWGDAVYLARRAGESGVHIIIVPSAKWKEDIRAEGFEIIGKLSRLANVSDHRCAPEASATNKKD
jgi:hypothetical protein